MSGKRTNGDARIDVGLGEILKGLGGFIELLGELGDAKEINKTGEFSGARGMRGVYGVSIKQGLGGAPVVEHFGNIRPTERGPEVSDVREPLVDIFDEADHVLVVVELPGVTNEDIRVQIDGDILTLEAGGRDRKYAKEVMLPAMVDAESLQRSFKNAILEIRLEKNK